MKREDFINTKWDVREWTEEQKIQWQEKCFELGFKWGGEGVYVENSDKNFYYLSTGILFGDDLEFFNSDEDNIKTFEDMFPEEKLDPIQTIVEMVNERKQYIEDSEEGDRGFEGLVYIEPDFQDTLTYYVVEKKSCSEDQWRYLVENLQLCTGSTGKEGSLQNCGDGNGWFGHDYAEFKDKIVTFNDLFQYKEDM